MSVRQGLLALLSEQPMHAYQLRQQFEERTGATWPLNMGQVSTTLDRLVRDGFVESVAGGDVPQYALTAAGRAELDAWWGSPVVRGVPSRDELAIKLALAVASPQVDVSLLVQTQRAETLRALRDLTRLKAGIASGAEDLAWSLVLDNLVFAAEAEIRWLDHVEARVARVARVETEASAPAQAPSPARVEVN